MARFDVTLGTSTNIQYKSDPYTCPFHNSYTDSRNIFEACTGFTNNAPTGIDFTPATLPIFGDPLLSIEGTNPIHDLGALVTGDTVAFRF